MRLLDVVESQKSVQDARTSAESKDKNGTLRVNYFLRSSDVSVRAHWLELSTLISLQQFPHNPIMTMDSWWLIKFHSSRNENTDWSTGGVMIIHRLRQCYFRQILFFLPVKQFGTALESGQNRVSRAAEFIQNVSK